jgi:hypothetical protein
MPRQVQLLAFCLATFLSACATGHQEPRRPIPAGVFIPQGATHVQQQEDQGTHVTSYDVAVPYPATAFLCELIQYLDQRQWRGLREDAMNPGIPTSLVRGWLDFEDATRQPSTHVTGWASHWLNEKGELLSYSLKYEYQEGAKPDLTMLRVSVWAWPADSVRAHFGDRANELPRLRLPALKDASGGERGACLPPRWSDLVTDRLRGAAPVAATTSAAFAR